VNLNRARKGEGSPLEPQPSPKGGTDTEVKDRGSPLAGSPLEPLLQLIHLTQKLKNWLFPGFGCFSFGKKTAVEGEYVFLYLSLILY